MIFGVYFELSILGLVLILLLRLIPKTIRTSISFDQYFGRAEDGSASSLELLRNMFQSAEKTT